ncbi:MAG: hypothetical protein HY242_04255 [Afipia sp.]|nr:hypothetical protein [Afipia sp.]
MLKSVMVGAAALAAVAMAVPDTASARPGGGRSGGGGVHFSGGGGARFIGGGAAFRGAAMPSFRSAAVGSAPRFAANAGRNWGGRPHWRRGFGYGGVALGLAAAPYYYNNYYNNYYDYPSYDTYVYTDGYDPYADNGGYYVTEQPDPGCYVRRRVHTRYGWRWRRLNVCG